MISVYVKKQSSYPISTPKVKQKLAKFFSQKGIVSDAEVSIAFVGKKEMLEMAKKYLNEKGILHNVLSFTEDELNRDFVYPPDNTIRLGEIIICYPKALEEAKKEEKLIEEKIFELLEHGAMHLVGIHHEQ